MQAGAEFPPVTLAHIDGSLYLVDGWHRVAAAITNNQHLVWADISEMTFNEARWYAAKANTEHGLQLKPRNYGKSLGHSSKRNDICRARS